jgi:toluene monooxygenase system ferredoxin subunit
MFKTVMTLDELWDGDMHPCVVDGQNVLLIRVGDRVFAYADRCAHLGLPLSDGYLHNCKLTCAGHHFEFDVCTGRGINPKTRHLVAFAVRIENGDVLVDVDRSPSPATTEASQELRHG